MRGASFQDRGIPVESPMVPLAASRRPPTNPGRSRPAFSSARAVRGAREGTRVDSRANVQRDARPSQSAGARRPARLRGAVGAEEIVRERECPGPPCAAESGASVRARSNPSSGRSMWKNQTLRPSPFMADSRAPPSSRRRLSSGAVSPLASCSCPKKPSLKPKPSQTRGPYFDARSRARVEITRSVARAG